MDESTAWRYIIQMLKGLKALHDLQILHRDLKCANVFISSDAKTVQIGDMNVSKIAKSRLANTQTGMIFVINHDPSRHPILRQS